MTEHPTDQPIEVVREIRDDVRSRVLIASLGLDITASSGRP